MDRDPVAQLDSVQTPDRLQNNYNPLFKLQRLRLTVLQHPVLLLHYFASLT